ncbi:class I SAM-dependent methyltransferase [Gramella jeungdoensis]|uniref:Class I SAM-dependent methyltransferase n=1 Tax=Gramella jeungdoensis TaxID=708091 RepID=A0ABT0YYX4_9FLAO|nr:class I SAM-dependent methyltransferase [Gramella jeungdoensis]MCM8568539.1 class I SAM-dependent methyltransferase [Gramella jeungdoensis]
MAVKFLQWLNMPSGKNWLDIGCGTGALSEAIENHMNPSNLSGIDTSMGYIERAKQRISMNQNFKTGSVDNLPFEEKSFDVVVSGLALNFFPNTGNALLEMKRVTKPEGVIGAYVWDYSKKMEFLRYFWDAAYQFDSFSKNIDEGVRFPICNSENLLEEFEKAGLKEVESTFLDIETLFKDFDDYWSPFLGGQGPAPGFLQSLSKTSQNKLKDKILERVNFESDGSIKLIARALVVKANR